MSTACTEVLEKHKTEFEEAKKGVDPDVASAIMKGSYIDRSLTPEESRFKHAWVAYHECM